MEENNIKIVYNEDSRKILEIIPIGKRISTTITSPPYFDMKDYQSENQVGYGQTYQDYLNDLKTIFEGVFEITEDDGSLWIIIDTFKRDNQVIPLPFDLTSKLKEIGWLLQDIIIWKKDKTVPWSSNGFVQRKFEYILFFTKTKKFKYNKDKVRVYDTTHLKKWWVKYPERYNPKGKALDEVWEFPIPTQGSWGEKYIKHFCPLPKDMVATMIHMSTSEGDIVLDPFAGSGTVLSQSDYMKRNYIGFELNKDYIEMFNKYLKVTFASNRKEYELLDKNYSQDDFEKKILELRALKFAKNLISHIQKEIQHKEFKIYVEIKGKSELRNKLIKVKYDFLGDLDKNLILEIINNIIGKNPFSKFGIEPIFGFKKNKKNDFKNHFFYSETNTYSFIQHPELKPDKIRIFSLISVNLNENDYL